MTQEYAIDIFNILYSRIQIFTCIKFEKKKLRVRKSYTLHINRDWKRMVSSNFLTPSTRKRIFQVVDQNYDTNLLKNILL